MGIRYEATQRLGTALGHSLAVHQHNRGGGIIEPQIKLQWFVGVNKEFTIPHSEIPGIASGSKTTLKQILIAAVQSGDTKITPAHFEKIYFHWVNNLRDWCVSRQIWFGHRIPVWYLKDEAGNVIDMIVRPDGPSSAEASKGTWEQDSDVLDTWFSSGLWTFSTLGWPENTPDLKMFHPTSVLETGYDILTFWVVRMIMMSGFHLGQIPFKQVYLHGMVRDGQGRKMSKSLGNIIDPLTMIEKYGADATRLSLVIGAQPGNDLKLDENRVRGYKHFANKLWNITRFVLENADASSLNTALTDTDKGLVAEAHELARSVSANIDNFRLDLAGDAVYHYVWDRFAAEIIEETKPVLKLYEGEEKASKQRMLYELLMISLKLLHPFMPFVTEAIWQELPGKDTDLLMIAKWPLLR